jgi:hypothetical protein
VAAARPLIDALRSEPALTIEALEKERDRHRAEGRDREAETYHETAQCLEAMHASVCVPLSVEQEIYGMLCIRDERVRDALLKAGFSDIESTNLWETRKVYDRFDLLAQDLRGRTGRSILHELDDGEIEQLIEHIGNRIDKSQAIFEKDLWTLWVAKKV